MSKNSLSLFNDPFFKNAFVGFESVVDDVLDDMKPTYPPRNILKYKDGSYKIELAVAGFSKDEITIKVEDGNKLIISGDNTREKSEECEYIAHGIASRNFTTTYQLYDTLEVEDAKLEDGILRVYIKCNDKKASVQTIDIN